MLVTSMLLFAEDTLPPRDTFFVFIKHFQHLDAAWSPNPLPENSRSKFAFPSPKATNIPPNAVFQVVPAHLARVNARSSPSSRIDECIRTFMGHRHEQPAVGVGEAPIHHPPRQGRSTEDVHIFNDTSCSRAGWREWLSPPSTMKLRGNALLD
jgi:hypothetical protein